MFSLIRVDYEQVVSANAENPRYNLKAYVSRTRCCATPMCC
jgi:hypothetical protein